MIDVQEKLIELLLEIDGICKEKQLKYYLCEESALSGYSKGGFLPSCCQLSIAMTTDDVMKFIKAVKAEGRRDREIDSIVGNRYYPDFTIRYGAANSLALKLPYNSRGMTPNIAVTIHMIRHKHKNRFRRFKLVRSFWKACYKPLKKVNHPVKKAAVAACHLIRKIVGEKRLNGMIFNSWCRSCRPYDGAKKISIAAGKFIFPAGLIKGDARMEFEGYEFPVFDHVETYLKKRYGASYQKYTPKYVKKTSSLLTSVNVPYKKYMERLEDVVDYNQIPALTKKYDKIQAKVKAYNDKINGYYAIVDRTEKRFAMYEKYMPMKDQLVELYQAEKYEELNELLKPYRSALWWCYKKKLGLCFDKDIFDMTMKILEMEGSTSYAAKCRKLVPEQHWEPIVITDHKGDAIEC